ncbi:MAG: aminotransferase class IV, partial [Gammaproteobacteria bacterium]|nr:aminotransferase class IV [Gammaproteobacteria bacterium]
MRSHQVDIADRGLNYGDGLFETIAIRGSVPRFVDLHLERLGVGCERLGIPPPDNGSLHEELHRLSRDCDHGTGKILVTRGLGPRGYAPPATPTTTRIVSVTTAPKPERDAYRHGVVVRRCETPVTG